MYLNYTYRHVWHICPRIRSRASPYRLPASWLRYRRTRGKKKNLKTRETESRPAARGRVDLMDADRRGLWP